LFAKIPNGGKTRAGGRDGEKSETRRYCFMPDLQRSIPTRLPDEDPKAQPTQESRRKWDISSSTDR